MFKAANEFNRNIGNWDVSSVTDMSGMFTQTYDFNLNIGSWDVSNVTNMGGMFFLARAFNQDLTKWCVTKISEKPFPFSDNSKLSPANHPVWGTCP